MAPNSVCTTCRQILREQFRHSRQLHGVIQQRNKFQDCNAPRRPITTISNPILSESTQLRIRSTRAASSAPTDHRKVSHALDPLSIGREGSKPKPQSTEPFQPIRDIAKEFRQRAPVTTETYIAYSICEKLVKECARQAEYKIPQAQERGAEIPKTKDGEDLGVGKGWWYETLGLTPTFYTWAQITCLHMYLLTVRFRMFPPALAPSWHQHLLNHFFYIAEERMTLTHNMAARSIRNKYLKDLFLQWRGLMTGYDEGLVRGDAVLATAVWRNVFKSDEGVDCRGLGEVVSYMRGVLQGLDEMEEAGVVSGDIMFGDPGTERDGVLVRSRMMESAGGGSQGTVKAVS